MEKQPVVYLVTREQQLFSSKLYKIISVEESLDIIKDWKIIQYDCETNGKNPHINELLSVQLGNKEGTIQLVIDVKSVDIRIYKDVLVSNCLVGHNLKFDIQWLYNYNIIPRKVYDTMIVEQLLYLGYPYIALSPEEYIKYEHTYPYKVNINEKTLKTTYELSYSLQAVAKKYLNIELDKSIRGEIIWKGLSDDVILYAASDVKYLIEIMDKQIIECNKKKCIKGAKLECDFTPVIAYLEWCGIKLDETKWKAKMSKDLDNLNNSLQKLNTYCINHPKLQKWVKIDIQGDLFYGFNDEPQWSIDWQKDEAKNPIKALGFNLDTVSKTTNQETESVTEKLLKVQKGIDDTFLDLYFDYQGYYKVCTSFGQTHLNLINPKTGRLHTNYKAIGTASGRMSCGGGIDDDLARYKKLPIKEVKMVNMQQLPHDAETRSCFVAEKDNLFCSCDYSSQEGRTQAEIYNERVLIDMYNNNLDSHSVNAKIFFKDELKDIDVKDVKKLRPDLRQAAKAPFFALSYGGDYQTLMTSLGISEDEAKSIVTNYQEGYKDTMLFAKKGANYVRNNGHIVISEYYGHKLYWWDYKKWIERQESFNSEFWEDYRLNHKGTNSYIAKEVKQHFQAISKYGRLARNAPSQGLSAIMTKLACIYLFDWIIENNYFSKILLVNVTHDKQICCV